MERPSWAPDEVDLDRPSVARVHDYYLGGSHNFAADRAFAEQVLRHLPELSRILHENRLFLRRAVRYLLDQGIRQFVDLGSGIPTVGSVHEVAHAYDPTATVVYVDIDPVAVAHSLATLEDNPHTAVVVADLRKPQDVLADPAVQRLIDFGRPVGFVLTAVLHFIPDTEGPADIVAGYLARACAGSHAVVSHAGSAPDVAGRVDRVVELYRRCSMPLVIRSADQVRALLGGLTVVAPGVVPPARWRPEPGEESTDPAHLLGSAAVGRKN